MAVDGAAEPTAGLELSPHLTFISSPVQRSGNGTFCDIVSQLRQFTPDSKVLFSTSKVMQLVNVSSVSSEPSSVGYVLNIIYLMRSLLWSKTSEERTTAIIYHVCLIQKNHSINVMSLYLLDVSCCSTETRKALSGGITIIWGDFFFL